MIRTAFIAVSLTLYTLVVGPPLILFTLVTKSATLMYWAGVKAVVVITRIAGEEVTVEGLVPGTDSLRLYEDALGEGISIAPGPMFSASGRHGSFTRLNTAFWSPSVEVALSPHESA